MTRLLALGLGTLLMLGGWLLPRAVAGTRMRLNPILPLDLCLPLTGFVWLCAMTARPIFAGTTLLVLGGGFAYADRAKRTVLAEPIVFTDIFQAFDIFRHPKLALPFPHLGRVLAGVLAVLIFFVSLFLAEPSAWSKSGWPGLLVSALILLAGWCAMGPWMSPIGRILRKLSPSGNAAKDAAAFGPLATQLAHGFLARAERARRRIPPPQTTRSAPVRATGQAGPIILVQCESFFDARRLHPAVPSHLLPVFDRCCRTGVQWGRLAVPSWGANTVRTEFEVLTGLSQSAIGMDWFDPYHRFANAPIYSLVWTLRAEGYRTLCLHPFDRTFYRRDRVMANLGFDAFLGEEAFVGAARRNGYVADAEVARVANEILRAEGPRTFLFLITMENHGPWTSTSGPALPDLATALRLPASEQVAFGRYLQGLKSADALLDTLSTALTAQDSPGLLAFYGDHLPSFPHTFRKLGLKDQSSDYLIWRTNEARGTQKQIAAHSLGEAMLMARYRPA